MIFKRGLKALFFIGLQALVAVAFASLYAPALTVECGIGGAALAALSLMALAGDEKSAQFFFFENWKRIERRGSPPLGLSFTAAGWLWLIPLLCFVFTLALAALRQLWDF